VLPKQLGIEGYLNELIKNTGNTKLKVIDSSQGVQTIATETIEGKQPKAGQNRPQYNPHIWLDPKRVIRQVENIRDGLIAADPAGKEIYTNNATAYIKKLRELDTEITKILQPFAGKTFVAFHDFAPYFAQSYLWYRFCALQAFPYIMIMEPELVRVIELFQLPFMQRALMGGILTGLMGGILGSFTILRQLSFFCDALEHSALLGISIGYLLGLNPSLVLLPFAAIFALAVSYLLEHTKLWTDALLNIILSIPHPWRWRSLSPGESRLLFSALSGNIKVA
jgi:Zinc-uptake complex component A periplasmic/ABC 3 transport family